MAVNFYVASSGGNNNNSGSSEGSPKASGTNAATVVGITVTLLVDGPDLSTVVVNDTIRLNGRADGRGGPAPNDIFKITAVDDINKTVDVTPAPNSITSGVTWAIGGAFATVRRGMAATEAGDTVYAKGSFTGLIDLTDTDFKNGGDPSTPISLIGYSGIPGDNGFADFNGTDTTANGISIPGSSSTRFWIFRNLHAHNYTNQGFRNTGTYPLIYENCEANNCLVGFKMGAIVNVVHCYAHDNTDYGMDVHDHVECYGCVFENNGSGIITDDGVHFYQCQFINNNIAIKQTGNFRNVRMLIFDSIIDGNGSGIGLDGWTDTYPGNTKIINSIIMNCGTGINLPANEGQWNLGAGNVFYNNSVNYSNWTNQILEVSGQPLFISEGIDYTPTSGSSVIGAGYDIRQNNFITEPSGQQAVIGGLLPVATPVADYPLVSNVRAGVSFNSGSQSGTLVLPSVNDVRDGIGFGAP